MRDIGTLNFNDYEEVGFKKQSDTRILKSEGPTFKYCF